MTVCELAQCCGVTPEQVQSALETQNILLLSLDIALSSEKLKNYYKIIQKIPGAKVVPEFESGYVSKPVPQPIPDPVPQPTPEERHLRLLSRDYVVFTYMALRKSGSTALIQLIVRLQSERKVSTRMVAVSQCIDEVMKAAETDTSIQLLAEYLKVLQNHRRLYLLKGTVAEENRVIGDFLLRQPYTKTILIVGVNRSLRTFVAAQNRKIRNERKNKGRTDYVEIYERDVGKQGRLTNPNNQLVVFESTNGKPKTNLSEAPLPMSGSIPGAGENVYMNIRKEWKPVKLGESIHSGGEGVIYKLESFPVENIQKETRCAKIFKEANRSELKITKIEMMCRSFYKMRNVDVPIMERISWPEALLYNEEYEPVGYIMKLFENVTPFSHYNARTFPTLIPNISKANQITMAVNLAELVDFMHYHNVILCDINKGNVLFDKNQQAYLVDLDSAQIADSEVCYPSNVGIPEFLSPEHIDDRTFSFIRKKADDVWILQMLLFFLLTPAGTPYSVATDMNEKDIIRQGMFPFQSGLNRASDDIAGGKGGIWHTVYSHFPRFLKELFWESFHGDGKYFHEARRQDANVWLNAMVRYQNELPQLIERDSESGKYLPERPIKYVRSKNSSHVVSYENGDLDELLRNLKTIPWET